MKRKLIFIPGLITALFYALFFIASLAFLAFGVIYFYANDIFVLFQEILTPLYEPVISLGKIPCLVALGCLTFSLLVMLIIGLKLIKYSSLENEKYSRKKGFIIFYEILTFIILVASVFSLIHSLQITYSSEIIQLIYIISTSLFTFLSLVCFVCMLISFFKYKYIKEVPQTAIKHETNSQTIIYTYGLDEEVKENNVEEKKKEKEENKIEKPTTEPQNPKSSLLVDQIAQLDKKRQNGEITQEQYVSLRQTLIRNYVK